MPVTKDGLVEELETVIDFCYRRHQDDFYAYCKERRNGKQSFEHLSMLVKSICGRESLDQIEQPPWRFLVSAAEANEMRTNLKSQVDLLVDTARLINNVTNPERRKHEA